MSRRRYLPKAYRLRHKLGKQNTPLILNAYAVFSCDITAGCTKDEINVPMALSVFRDGSPDVGHRLTLYTTDGHGIFNVRTYFSVRVVHTKGSPAHTI